MYHILHRHRGGFLLLAVADGAALSVFLCLLVLVFALGSRVGSLYIHLTWVIIPKATQHVLNSIPPTMLWPPPSLVLLVTIVKNNGFPS